jgi:hypothetical protein
MSKAERQKRWRKSTPLKHLDVYLSPGPMARLDAALERYPDGWHGRGHLLDHLIEGGISEDGVFRL